MSPIRNGNIAEFRPFAAVEQGAGDFLLPDYSAARPPLPHLLLPEDRAATATADSIFRRFLRLRGVRAAIKRSIFIDRPWRLKPILQQESVAKVFLLPCHYQQKLSI